MKVIILTEGNKKIGFGHITRCISLSQVFEEKNIAPELIVDSDDAAETLLEGKKYHRFNWRTNKDRLFKLVGDADVIIVDSYLADAGIYNRLSGMVRVPVYIDDNKRLNYPQGIVVNGCVHAEKIRYPNKNKVKYLLGSRYIPLRSGFKEAPKKRIRKKVKNILITFGGVDKAKTTVKIMEFLKKEYPEFIKNIVVGSGFAHAKKIMRMRDGNTNIIRKTDAEGMKKVMLESDVAISAGGQTIYELAAMGVPTIALAVADNQVNSLMEWQKLGFIKFTYLRQDFIDQVRLFLKEIMDMKVRMRSSAVAKRYVDGKGAVRIVNKILGVWNKAQRSDV